MRWARPSTIAVLPTPGSPMRIGLFLVRRERIWISALDLAAAADHRVELAGARRCRQVDAKLVDGGRAGAGAAAGAGALRRALGEDARRLRAHALQADAERLEDAEGDALALADEAEEQVLRADVAVVEAARLFDGELDDLLGARRQANLAADRLLAAADDELDGRADLAQLDAEVVEHLGGDAIALADEAEEQMLRADVVVVEALRFFLGEGQDSARSLREFVKSVCHFAPSAPYS